ncbi:MAG: DNA polymerase III subunit gamma/tau [Acidobacteriota bacterium]|nr:DNA polymerase III subunit gamma/tau [Blastocatellia bacterium]MDW8238094.1 DNA polymerase III subunit gamma/tau [Acidobacteriota bacterium]
MGYQVIARKWRPQTFEDVVGQEPITRTLYNAVADQRLHHAYIFAGPRGVGKTTTARILARALNCVNGPTPHPCGQCAACVEIAQGHSIDVLEIDAATHTQVDNVREVIINTIATTPARDRYKIFIIDEVHQLSNHAFNALLKTLEEPPPHVLFIMATTERHKVPETILSRCQFFEFRLIPENKIYERLRLIAEQERISISETALRRIARAGEGSLRDAQSAFDQVISFAGTTIHDDDVASALGLIGPEWLAQAATAIADGDSPKVLQVVQSLVEHGHDVRYFCRELMVWFRHLLVLNSVGYDSELLPLSTAELNALQPLAQRFSPAELIRAFHLLTEIEQTLRYTTEPRFQLEIGLIKLAQAGRLRSVAELVARLEALEKRVRSSVGDERGSGGSDRLASASGVVAPSPAAPAGEKPEPATERLLKPRQSEGSKQTATAVAPALRADGLRAQLQAALNDRRKMLLAAMLDDAAKIELVGETLRVVCRGSGGLLKETLSQRDQIRLIEATASELVGHPVKLLLVVEDESPAPTPLTSWRQMAEQDPTVQALIKTFKGELTNVKPKA